MPAVRIHVVQVKVQRRGTVMAERAPSSSCIHSPLLRERSDGQRSDWSHLYVCIAVLYLGILNRLSSEAAAHAPRTTPRTHGHHQEEPQIAGKQDPIGCPMQSGAAGENQACVCCRQNVLLEEKNDVDMIRDARAIVGSLLASYQIVGPKNIRSRCVCGTCGQR